MFLESSFSFCNATGDFQRLWSRKNHKFLLAGIKVQPKNNEVQFFKIKV